MQVKLFVTTSVTRHGISSNVFFSEEEAKDYLSADFKSEIKECGGLDEFFDTANSDRYGYIERLEVNEVSFNLKELIAAAEEEKNGDKPTEKPYLFTVKEVMDGYENTTVALAYTNNPTEKAKEIARKERESDEEDWNESVNGYKFNGGDYVTCSQYQAITYAQAVLWSMANNLQHLVGESHD